MDSVGSARWTVPGWLKLGVSCALAYFALGQMRLVLVYPLLKWLPPQTFHPVQIDYAILAVWLASITPAFSRHPHSARWAAYSAGIGAGGGVALHLLGRWILWPQLEGGCWVHTVQQGGLADLVCADILPAPWREPELVYGVLGWSLGSMAFAFVLGAAVIGVRYLARRRIALT